MSPSPLLWLAAFVWTLAVELPIYVVWLRRRMRRWWAPCLLAFVVNLATHPAFWYGFPRFGPYWLYVLVGEVCVVIVETAIVVAALGPRRRGLAFGAGLTANAASTLVGLWLFPLVVRSG